MLIGENENIYSTTLFEKFRSQLFFSDPEIYMITTMIINFFEEKKNINILLDELELHKS